eukprot:scaffold7035_cov162-Skeletonema_dohrnii-CCMP3373.AAC.3
MKTFWLTSMLYLAVQNLSTETLIPTMTRGRKTRSNDVPTQRMKHFLDVWMEGDAWLKEALSSMQITSYMQLVDLLKDPNTVNSIKNRKDNGTEEDIRSEDAAKLRCCLSFANHLQMREGPITDGLVDITTVDADEFNNFYIMAIPFVTYDDTAATERKSKREFLEAKTAAVLAQKTVQPGTQGVPSVGATANSQTSTTSTANSRELEAFRKNIKMDASTYPILADDAAWHAFNQEWTALCVLYQIKDVLEPNYIPPLDKVDLFKAHQSFLMTVMMAKIKTTRGKEIVRSHVANNNAQAAWKDLVEYYRGP